MRLQVFVSYAQTDGARAAKEVKLLLSTRGFRTWSDTDDVQAGDTLTDAVFAAIRGCHAAICVVSPRWLESRWCLAEAAAFKVRGVPLVPMLESGVSNEHLPEFLRGYLCAQNEQTAVLGLAKKLGRDALRIYAPQGPVQSFAKALAGALELPTTSVRIGTEQPPQSPEPCIVLLPSSSLFQLDYLSMLSERLAVTQPVLLVSTTSDPTRLPGRERIELSDGHLRNTIEAWVSGLPTESKDYEPFKFSNEVWSNLENEKAKWLNGDDNGVRRAALALSGRLEAFSQAHRFGLRRTRDALEWMASGVFFIYNREDIYQHDAEVLGELKPGDTYHATHPTDANPAPQSAAYQRYTDALCDAARRGVDIERIYIVDGPVDHDELSLPEPLHREARELNTAGVTTWVAQRAHVNYERNRSSDFVIINGKVVGHAEPLEGPMLRSKYLIGTDTNHQHLRGYEAYFRQLKRAAREVDLRAKDAEEPAFETQNEINGLGLRKMGVLRTIGCAWDRGNTGCTMCDFKRHSLPGVTTENLVSQLDSLLKRTSPQTTHFELLTLGSFLHDLEVPRTFRQHAMKRISEVGSIRSVLVESRAEYVRADSLADLAGLLRPDQELELGLGIETSNEVLRNRVLQKGLSDRGIERVMTACKDAGVRFVAYLLIKPQTLDETAAIMDAVDSAEWVLSTAKKVGVDVRIAFEPVFITKGTRLEAMFLDKKYSILNLWSVAHIAKVCASRAWKVFFGMSDENLSGNRVPTSCPKCAAALRAAIDSFNATQSTDAIDAVTCGCRAGWSQVLEHLPREYHA